MLHKRVTTENNSNSEIELGTEEVLAKEVKLKGSLAEGRKKK